MEYLSKLSPLFTAGIFLFAFLGGIFIIVDNKIAPIKKDIGRLEIRLDRLEVKLDQILASLKKQAKKA